MNEQLVRPPYVLVEEHEGAMLLTVPGKGVERELIKSMVYGVVAADDRMLWHFIGEFTDACEVITTVIEHNPGMLQVIHGLLEARAHSRARRVAQEERSL